MNTRFQFNEYGHLVKGRFPKACVADCSAQGAVDHAVAHWRQVLQFSVPRDLAIRYLLEFGAWNRAELAEKSDEDLAEIVLWLAACEMREERRPWLGLLH